MCSGVMFVKCNELNRKLQSDREALTSGLNNYTVSKMSKYFRLERIDHLNVKIKLSLTFISNQSCWWGVAHSQAADWPRSLLVFDKAGLLALGPWAQTLWSTSSPNKSSTQSWPVKASELSEVNFTLEGLSTHIYRPLKKQFELSSCSDYSVTLQLFS